MNGLATAQTQIVEEGKHLLGEFIGDPLGKTLVVFGSVHGNESSGVRALQRVSPEIESFKDKLQGRVFFLAGNTRAMAKGLRFIGSDLNRHWTAANLSRNEPNLNNPAQISEDHEQRELLEILHPILQTANDEVYVLDLHSTSADGVPFITLGDTLRNREFARKFPATILLGIEEQLDGTILEYLNNLGCVTLGFEGGQHFAESTVDNHEALIWLALANSGLLAMDCRKYSQVLRTASGKARFVEIRHREAVEPEKDGFEMKEGYENFQPVRKGEVLAKNDQGEITANETGMILMPLYQKLGNDGFFLAPEVAPFWLWLSRVLRKAHVAELIHILPGVKKHPTEPGTFIVDTGIARLFPLQIFHLLGLRKQRWLNRQLVVSRRLYDTRGPFVRN